MQALQVIIGIVVMQILMTGACKYDPQDDANEGSVNKLHPGARVSKHVLHTVW